MEDLIAVLGVAGVAHLFRERRDEFGCRAHGVFLRAGDFREHGEQLFVMAAQRVELLQAGLGERRKGRRELLLQLLRQNRGAVLALQKSGQQRGDRFRIGVAGEQRADGLPRRLRKIHARQPRNRRGAEVEIAFTRQLHQARPGTLAAEFRQAVDAGAAEVGRALFLGGFK
jgi:hypothetical protein